MKLGTYTFEHLPDQFDPPRPKKSAASLETYSSVAYFSWGVSILGAEILLEWDRMTCDQFNRHDIQFQADAALTWDPEILKKICHGAVTNGPFVVGRTLTGVTSTATGTVTKVEQGDGVKEMYLEFTPLTLVFQVGETFNDNSSPQKSAVITSFENVGTYTVEIKALDGKYFEPFGPAAAYRQDVKMLLLIMAVL